METHLKDDDTEALRKRVNSTVNDLKKISKELSKLSCGKAAKFIRDHSNFMVTFAWLAAEEEKEVPWNSNIIERLMGEISKRCKHKWMRWTTRGIGAILWIILVKYTNEKDYEIFKDEMMSSENLKYITCEDVTISAGGVI